MKETISVLDKISSVLMDLNNRLGEVESPPTTDYCNQLISEIQQTIVSMERSLKSEQVSTPAWIRALFPSKYCGKHKYEYPETGVCPECMREGMNWHPTNPELDKAQTGDIEVKGINSWLNEYKDRHCEKHGTVITPGCDECRRCQDLRVYYSYEKDLQLLREELERMRQDKDNAYLERNSCVAALAKLAVAMGWKAGLGKHTGEGPWDSEWTNIVYINLPSGQVSWHIHDREMVLFNWLAPYLGKWDGHGTREKYERLAALKLDHRIEALKEIADIVSRLMSNDGALFDHVRLERRLRIQLDAIGPDYENK